MGYATEDQREAAVELLQTKVTHLARDDEWDLGPSLGAICLAAPESFDTKLKMEAERTAVLCNPQGCTSIEIEKAVSFVKGELEDQPEFSNQLLEWGNGEALISRASEVAKSKHACDECVVEVSKHLQRLSDILADDVFAAAQFNEEIADLIAYTDQQEGDTKVHVGEQVGARLTGVVVEWWNGITSALEEVLRNCFSVDVNNYKVEPFCTHLLAMQNTFALMRKHYSDLHDEKVEALTWTPELLEYLELLVVEVPKLLEADPAALVTVVDAIAYRRRWAKVSRRSPELSAMLKNCGDDFDTGVVHEVDKLVMAVRNTEFGPWCVAAKALSDHAKDQTKVRRL